MEIQTSAKIDMKVKLLMFFYRCRCLKPIPPGLDIKTLDSRRVPTTIEKNWAYSERKNPSKAVDKKSELFKKTCS